MKWGDEMDPITETGKVTVSSFVAYFMVVAGESFAIKLIVLLIMLMVFDFALGWAKAKKADKWKSSKARWGALGKIFELGFVAIAWGLDWVFGTEIIKQVFIAYFCLVEVGSLLENAHAIGVPIPKEAVGMATKSKHFFGWFFVKRLEGILEATFKMDYQEIEKIAKEKQDEEGKKE